MCDRTLCDTVPGETSSPQIRNQSTDHSKDIKSPIWGTSGFYWGHLQELKWLKDHCIPKPNASMSDSWQKLESWRTLHSLQAACGRTLSREVSRSKPLPVQLGLSESISWLSWQLVCAWRGRSLVNLISFRDFLELFWGCCCFVFLSWRKLIIILVHSVCLPSGKWTMRTQGPKQETCEEAICYIECWWFMAVGHSSASIILKPIEFWTLKG